MIGKNLGRPGILKKGRRWFCFSVKIIIIMMTYIYLFKDFCAFGDLLWFCSVWVLLHLLRSWLQWTASETWPGRYFLSMSPVEAALIYFEAISFFLLSITLIKLQVRFQNCVIPEVCLEEVHLLLIVKLWKEPLHDIHIDIVMNSTILRWQSRPKKGPKLPKWRQAGLKSLPIHHCCFDNSCVGEYLKFWNKGDMRWQLKIKIHFNVEISKSEEPKTV